MSDRTLNLGQAYILTSLAKHADKYRRAIESLGSSVARGTAHGPRMGINLDAANKAHYSAQVIEELLDQAEEMFENITREEISQLTGMALKPTDRGSRRRYIEGDEY